MTPPTRQPAAGGLGALEGQGGRPRDHVLEVQRRRILSAMARVAGEQGVAGATVAHVVARAGVSRRTFYDLFEDRQECFLAAFDEAVERTALKVGAAYRAEVKWVDGVRAGLLELLAFMEGEPELARLCVVEALAAGPDVLDRRRELLGALAAVVDGGRLKAPKGPPPLTAEGVVGAVFSVIHARLTAPGVPDGEEARQLTGLLGSLMGIVVLPYLGSAAAARELERPAPEGWSERHPGAGSPNLLEGLEIRLTYRTLRVLTVIAEQPGASNRDIAVHSGVADQGQISKLLNRLQRLALIENSGAGQPKGASNSWQLTPRGGAIQRTIAPHERSPRRARS